MKREIIEIVKFCFMFASFLMIANIMFLAGVLIGEYGNDNAKGIVFIFTPVFIFWLGRWSYKYKDLNPF